MADTRTRRQKLEAMANQKASPREAEVARELLRKLAGAAPIEAVYVEAAADEWLIKVRYDERFGLRMEADVPAADGPAVLREMLKRYHEGQNAPKLTEGDG